MTGIGDQRLPGSARGAAVGDRGRAPSPLSLIRHRSTHVRYLLLALLPPLAITQAVWAEGSPVRAALGWLGYFAVVGCVLGRAWCSAYIAGRKNRELVDHGPYSLTRNPLYGFSLLGLAGVGLQTGSLTLAALLALGSSLYYGVVVRREEAHLLAAFPVAYRRYLASTPRWLPSFRLWRDVGEVTIRPALVGRTLMDGAVFFAAYPLLEALGKAHAAGLVPALLSLP
jgi:protein-S-isoprenylcysteine O-methyltransferase Ste14